MEYITTLITLAIISSLFNHTQQNKTKPKNIYQVKLHLDYIDNKLQKIENKIKK